MFARALSEFGRCLRETGQAVDRVGLRVLEKPIFKEPFSRHRTVMNLYDAHPSVSPDAFVAPNASVIGSVTVSRKASVWYGAVVRGDNNGIEVGAYTSIGDGAVVHTAKSTPGKPAAVTKIGSHVTIGPGAVIQSAVIEDHATIGAGAVVMEGALVEAYAVVADGAVVHPGRRVPHGQVWGGNPATFVRDATATEQGEVEGKAEETADLAAEHAHEFLPYSTAYQQAEALGLAAKDGRLAQLEQDQAALDQGKTVGMQISLEEREIEGLVRPAAGLHPPPGEKWTDVQPMRR